MPCAARSPWSKRRGCSRIRRGLPDPRRAPRARAGRSRRAARARRVRGQRVRGRRPILDVAVRERLSQGVMTARTVREPGLAPSDPPSGFEQAQVRQVVAEEVALRGEVPDVVLVDRLEQRHPPGQVTPCSVRPSTLSELLVSNRTDATPRWRRTRADAPKSRRSTGRPRAVAESTVEPLLVLQDVRADLRDETDPAPLVPTQVHQTPQPSSTIASSADRSCAPHSHRRAPNTSPVRHSECTRTSTSSRPRGSPRTRARCSCPSSGSRNATARNGPRRVTSSDSATSASPPSYVSCMTLPLSSPAANRENLHRDGHPPDRHTKLDERDEELRSGLAHGERDRCPCSPSTIVTAFRAVTTSSTAPARRQHRPGGMNLTEQRGVDDPPEHRVGCRRIGGQDCWAGSRKRSKISPVAWAWTYLSTMSTIQSCRDHCVGR